LGLLPKVFGQDVSGVFRQRYSGHITIVPNFRVSEMLGLKAFMNPTVEDMAHYIDNGERNLWATIPHILHNTAIERVLTECVVKLRRQTYLSLRTGANRFSRTNLLSETKPPPILSPPSWGEGEGDAKTPSGDTQRGYEDDQDILESPNGEHSPPTTSRAFDVGKSLGGISSGELVAENAALRQENEKLRELLTELLRHQNSSLTHGPEEDDHDDDHDDYYYGIIPSSLGKAKSITTVLKNSVMGGVQ